MPFPLTTTPSIQLGILYSYLKSKHIPVDVHHAYLRCADVLSPELYFAISSTQTDEIFYPYFLFPEHFEKYRRKINNFWNSVLKNLRHVSPVPLETVLDKLKSFNEVLINQTDFSKYSLVGFTVTYDQLKSSIFLAREIKRHFPGIQTVFGGAQCTGDLGIGLLKTFPEIDFVISGEGEETLASLFKNLNKNSFEDIKGLGWKKDGSVKYNYYGPSEALIVDNLPVPDYREYFDVLEQCSPALKRYVRNYLSIPVEGSRGCWWNKCTFCNLNAQYSAYMEKSVKKITDEVKEQVERYRCHSIEFIANVQRIRNFGKLMSGLKNLNKNLNIFIEIRAGRLKKKDYQLMRDAGVKIVQIGIEAFGNKLLKKIDKGVTTIENVAAIKYCQEFGILPIYNIIYNYPNEEDADLDETAQNVEYLKGLIPPLTLNPFWLGYKSPVFNNPDDFKIKKIKRDDTALWRFPKTTWKTLVPFYYTYITKVKKKDRASKWLRIFSAWQQTGKRRIVFPLLSYQDAVDFVTITDRLSERVESTTLEGIDRELFIFCDTIQTKSDIFKNFPMHSPQLIEEKLEAWVSKRWMYKEGDKFLTLSVKINPTMPSITYLYNYTPNPNDLLKNWNPPSQM